jgi:hypothetical protein
MFNPGAGGSGGYVGIGKVIESAFSGHKLITGSSVFGSNYVTGAEVAGNHLENDFQKILDDTLASFVRKGVDMIIGVGGDGFLTHIAGFLIRQDVHVPLMGIAGGTANIGPLIKFNQHTLRCFSSGDMILEKVGCIEVTTGGSILGYAFCDVILGDTFLGTKENRICNFSAKDFLETGKKVETKPGERITGKQFSLLKNSSKQRIKSKKIAQIIASPLYHKDFYRGKAITGALCYSPHNNCGASIGISDSIIVNSNSSMEQSIIIENFLFGPGDTIKIEDLNDDTHVIIDGNVYEIKDRSVEMRYIEDGVQSVTMKTYNGLPVSNAGGGSNND